MEAFELFCKWSTKYMYICILTKSMKKTWIVVFISSCLTSWQVSFTILLLLEAQRKKKEMNIWFNFTKWNTWQLKKVLKSHFWLRYSKNYFLYSNCKRKWVFPTAHKVDRTAGLSFKTISWITSVKAMRPETLCLETNSMDHFQHVHACG